MCQIKLLFVSGFWNSESASEWWDRVLVRSAFNIRTGIWMQWFLVRSYLDRSRIQLSVLTLCWSSLSSKLNFSSASIKHCPLNPLVFQFVGLWYFVHSKIFVRGTNFSFQIILIGSIKCGRPYVELMSYLKWLLNNS